MQLIGVIAVCLVAVFLIGFLLIPKQKYVAAKYDEAKALYDDGEIEQATGMIDEFVIFPVSGKYSYEYAQQLLKSLDLVKAITVDENIDINHLINPVKAALESVPSEGGKVDAGITDPLEEWINTLGSKAENIGDTDVLQRGSEADFTSDVEDREQLDIINKMGRYLLRGKYKDGIAFADSHMPAVMGPFKASLMDQKAALLFMSGDIADAVDIYQQILDAYPDTCRIRSSLAEGLVEIGQFEAAVENAQTVVQNSEDRDLVRTCRKILKKYG